MASFRDAVPCKQSIIFCLYLLLSTHGVRGGPQPQDKKQPEVSGRLGTTGLATATLSRIAQNIQANAQVLQARASGVQPAAAAGSTFTGLPGVGADGGGAAGLLPGFGLSLNPFKQLMPAGSPQTKQSLGSTAPVGYSRELIQALMRSPMEAFTPEPLSPEMDQLLSDASDSSPENAADQAQAVATLAVLANVFNLVAAILYIVSGGLGTLATSLAFIPATLALVTGPISFFLAADSFASTLTSDAQTKAEDIYTSWTAALTALADQLQEVNNGTITGQLASLRAQLADVKDLLLTAATPFTITTGGANDTDSR